MPEPGSTEGQEGQTPKTTPEQPFPRKTGDLSSFTKAAENLSSLVGEANTPEPTEPFAREKGSDLPSFTEANSRLTEILHTPSEQLIKEFGEVSENVDRQAGAVNLVKGFIEWAKATKDKAVTKMLTGNVASIVRGLANNPDKVSDTVTAWTGEDTQAFQKKLKDAGMITVEQRDKLQEAINAGKPSGNETDVIRQELKSALPTTEPPIATAK